MYPHFYLMADFLMKVDYDEDFDEYFLKFLDIDDRAKKSRFLKNLLKNNVTTVTMTISENSDKATPSQVGLYNAFVILLKDYTGYDQDEVKDLIYKNLDVSKEEIQRYNRKEFSEFIDKLYRMCSEQIGIQVEMIDNKLTIIKPENE